MAKAQVLQFNPANELVFDGPFTVTGECYLTLTNPANEPVYFKVKTTAPRYYCVRPNSGVIQPNESAKVTIMLQPVDHPSALDKERAKHKFMIQSAFQDESIGEDVAVEDFWKKVDPSKVMDFKLKVLFNNLITPDGADSGAHSGHQSVDSSVYHEDTAQPQPVQRRPPQQTSHEDRKPSPSETAATSNKERVRLEEDNRSLTMQVQELRHKLNAIGTNPVAAEGFPIVQVILLALAALLVGIILGKLF